MKKTLFASIFCVLQFIGFCQSETDSLIFYTELDQGEAIDSIGDNDGVVSLATPTTDRFGLDDQALFFNENANVRFAATSSLMLGTENFTISLWFSSEDSTHNGVLFNKGRGANDLPRIFLRFTGGTEPGMIQWRLGDENNTVESSYTNTSLFNGEWNHAALVREDTALSFYLNGELIERTVDASISTINPDSDRSFYLGAQERSATSSSLGNFLSGSLDDVKIYRRALDGEEVLSLFDEEVIEEEIDYTDPIACYSLSNGEAIDNIGDNDGCLLYTSPSPRDA